MFIRVICNKAWILPQVILNLNILYFLYILKGNSTEISMENKCKILYSLSLSMFHTLVCHSGLLEISRSGTFWFKLSKKLEGHHIGICQILLSGLLHCFLVCVSFSMICLATVFCQEFQSVGTLTCTAWKGGDSLEKGADQPIQYLKLEWHRPLTSSVCSLLLWLLN